MLSLLTEPWRYEFMRNAIAIGTIIGILCPIVGSYLIVQRMALMGDVIAHAVLPGLVLSFALGVDILFGSFVSGILGSLIIAWIRAQSRVKVDAAMALTFSSFFAVGVMLITMLKVTRKFDLESFLFGNILGVTAHDIHRSLAIAIVILVVIKLVYKELLLYTFDRVGAQAVGLPIQWIHVGFMAGITLTIIASMQAVGVILVIALLVGPALTAYLLVRELHQMMLLGAGFGITASVIGIYMSFYINVPSGPAIVLVSSTFFLLSLLLSPSQGVLRGARGNG
jgi:manganese/iron transport system permease protein